MAKPPYSQTRVPTEPPDHWDSGRRGEVGGLGSIHCPPGVPCHGARGGQSRVCSLRASQRVCLGQDQDQEDFSKGEERVCLEV